MSSFSLSPVDNGVLYKEITPNDSPVVVSIIGHEIALVTLSRSRLAGSFSFASVNSHLGALSSTIYCYLNAYFVKSCNLLFQQVLK
jgi:hypothetical protein